MSRMFKNMKDLRAYATEKEMRNIDQDFQNTNEGMPSGAYSSSSNYLQERRPSGYKKYVSNNFTPAQMQLYNQLYGLVDPNGRTSRLAMGDEGEFEKTEAPALRQFGQLQGNIASKFSGQGMGSRKSSGFQNTQSAAAQDFAGQLQANRQNLQRQSIMDLMGISQQLLQQGPYTSGYAAKGDKGGIAGGYGAPAGAAVGAAIGGYFGQPGTGASVGGGVGGMFD